MSEDFQLFGSLSIQVSVELMNMLFVTSCVVLKSNFHSFWPLMVWDSQDLLYSGIQRVSKELSGSGVLKTEIRGFTKSKDISFGTCRWLTHQQSESRKNLIKLESGSRQSSSCFQKQTGVRPYVTWHMCKGDKNILLTHK